MAAEHYWFVLRCTASELHDGQLSLAFTKKACNPRLIDWCLNVQRAPVTVFAQDVAAKVFCGYAQLASLSGLPPAADATARPASVTRELFAAPVIARLRDVVPVLLPFSRTEQLINALHPPSGQKSLSQAVMGQQVDPQCAAEAVRLFRAEQAARQRPPASNQCSDSDENRLSFVSESTDTGAVLSGLLHAVAARYGQPTVLHASALGSRRYGVALADSDVDLFVVVLLSMARFCSVLDPPLQLLQNASHAKPDYALVEAQCYARMLLDGDPRTVESLFVLDPLLPNCTDLFAGLIERRRRFLTVRLVRKLLSDATSARKMRALVCFDQRAARTDPATAQPPAARQKLWYLIVRLLLHADEIVHHRHITVPLSPPHRDELLQLRHADSALFAPAAPLDCAAAQRCFHLLDRIEAALAASPTPLPLIVDHETKSFVEAELLRWRLFTLS